MQAFTVSRRSHRSTTTFRRSWSSTTSSSKKIEGKPNALPTFEEALLTQETLAAIGYELLTR